MSIVGRPGRAARAMEGHAMRCPGTVAVAMGMLALGAAGAQPQELHHDPHMLPASKIEVRAADGRVVIPFRLSANHLLIPITIQGTTLEMILDTGMPMDGVMLYRDDKVGRLALPAEKGMEARVAGAGGEGGPVAAQLVQGLTIDIGDLRLTEARAIVTPPMPGLGFDHDGVIGASLFANFVVSIDFDAGRITLHDPKRWVPPAGAATLPLSVERNLPFASVGIVTADGRRVPTTVVVDLGASHPISLNIGETQGIEVPPGAVRAIIGRGVGGVLRGQVGRVAGVDLGGLALKDVVATFPDSEHQGPGGRRSKGGNLGTGLLRHFNVAFDYGGGTLYLSPNKAFGQPFDWDMSGLWLDPDDQGRLRVAFIVSGSPAEKAGIQVGDILARVDDKPVSPADLPMLGQRFREAGGIFAMTLSRDGRPLDATLRLKRYV
jgi:hypothetical protein